MLSTDVVSESISQEDKFTDAKTDEIDVLFSEGNPKQVFTGSISNLKAGNSAGPDKIQSAILQHANEVVIDFLVELFNRLFDCGTFPLE